MAIQRSLNPKKIEEIHPFKFPYVEQEDDVDVLHLLGLILSMIGLVFKIRHACLASLVAAIISFSNSTKSKSYSRQGFSSFSFAIVGLGLSYLQEYGLFNNNINK